MSVNALDKLPGNRCSNAIALLNKVSLDKTTFLQAEDDWLGQAAFDLRDCGLVTLCEERVDGHTWYGLAIINK